MRLRRRTAGVALAVAFGTAAAIGLSGPAFASVDDPNGLHHIQGWADGKCLYGNPNHDGANEIQAYRCENSSFEQWSVTGPLNHTQLVNKALQLCAEPNTPGVDKSAIVMRACDANDINQFWNYKSLISVPKSETLNQWVNAGTNNLCMDRPTEGDYDGEPMQMWVCDTATQDPFGSDHYEQSGILTQHI